MNKKKDMSRAPSKQNTVVLPPTDPINTPEPEIIQIELGNEKQPPMYLADHSSQEDVSFDRLGKRKGTETFVPGSQRPSQQMINIEEFTTKKTRVVEVRRKMRKQYGLLRVDTQDKKLLTLAEQDYIKAARATTIADKCGINKNAPNELSPLNLEPAPATKESSMQQTANRLKQKGLEQQKQNELLSYPNILLRLAKPDLQDINPEAFLSNDVTSHAKYKSEKAQDLDLNTSMMKVRTTEIGEPCKRSVLGTGTAHNDLILSKELEKAKRRNRRNLQRKGTNQSIGSTGSRTTLQSNLKGCSQASGSAMPRSKLQKVNRTTTFDSNRSGSEGGSPRSQAFQPNVNRINIDLVHERHDLEEDDFFQSTGRVDSREGSPGDKEMRLTQRHLNHEAQWMRQSKHLRLQTREKLKPGQKPRKYISNCLIDHQDKFRLGSQEQKARMSVTSQFKSLFSAGNSPSRNISRIGSIQVSVQDTHTSMMPSQITQMNKSQMEDMTKLEKRKFSTKEARDHFSRGLRNAGYTFEQTTKNHVNELFSTNPVPIVTNRMPIVDFSHGNSFFQKSPEQSVYQSTERFQQSLMAFTAEKDKPQTTGLNFREFRGIMTPSSVMGSIGRVPGGPLSRNEKQRANKTSYMASRYGPGETSQIQNGYNNVFPETQTSRIDEDGNAWNTGSVHLPTTIQSTQHGKSMESQNYRNGVKPQHTFYSKAQRDRKKGVFQGELYQLKAEIEHQRQAIVQNNNF